MPLIIITGRPCTGKTIFAKRLYDHLLASGIEQVVLVNEESLNLSRKECYENATKEKVLRGAIKSASDHALSTSTFVIVDSLNYIKGYRYELYCTARTVRTPHCVVWVAANEDASNKWNKERIELSGDAYDETVLVDLRKRYEPPNESNRWDAPLFRVSLPSSTENANLLQAAPKEVAAKANTVAEAPSSSGIVEAPVAKVKSSWKPKKANLKQTTSLPPSSDDTSVMTTSASGSGAGVWFSGNMGGVSDDVSGFHPPEQALEAIAAYFSTAQAPAPNCSTVVAQHAQADLLYELDRTSQQITQLLVTHQAENAEGTPLRLVDYDRALNLNRFASMAELQRLRRQWVKINAQHPPSSIKAIGASFIDFLAVHLL